MSKTAFKILNPLNLALKVQRTAHTLTKTKQAHIIDHFDYRVARLRLFFNITADQYGGALGEYRRVNDAFSV